MPYILDKATGETRGVSQAVYDQWIQQTDRFGAAPENAPAPAVVEDAPSSASDLVGTGNASTSGFVDVLSAPTHESAPEPQPEPTPEN